MLSLGDISGSPENSNEARKHCFPEASPLTLPKMWMWFPTPTVSWGSATTTRPCRPATPSNGLPAELLPAFHQPSDGQLHRGGAIHVALVAEAQHAAQAVVAEERVASSDTNVTNAT